VRSAGVGAIVCAPSDRVLDPHPLVQPDLYVVPLVDERPSIRAERLEWQPAGANAPYLPCVFSHSAGYCFFSASILGRSLYTMYGWSV